MDENAYESVVEDFLSLYTFNAEGLKEAYRKEFKESFPIEKIETIFKSRAEYQADNIRSEIKHLGLRAFGKFLIRRGEFELPYENAVNAEMVRLFVKPVYDDDCNKASQIVLNSMLYRL